MKSVITTDQLIRCTPQHLPHLLRIQEEAFADMTHDDRLRRNSPEMLSECLSAPHVTFGYEMDGILSAFGILYLPQDEKEDLSHLLTTLDGSQYRNGNYKLCIVSPKCRGLGLQVAFGQAIEAEARDLGLQLLCATVAPDNAPSLRNVAKLGYTLDCALTKYGFDRNLYYKRL